MRSGALALLVLLAAAAAGAEETASVPTPPAPPRHTTPPVSGIESDTSPLVKASHAAKADSKKKPHARKVITNADVKRSRTVLKTTPAVANITVEVAKPAPKQPTYAARKDAEQRVTVAERRAAELKSEMNRLEESFYDERDPEYRDSVIRGRFLQTRRQYELAEKELADARDALEALGR